MDVIPLVCQFLLNKSSVSEIRLNDFLLKIHPEEPQVKIMEVMDRIKSTLNSFNLTVELTRCELTGMKYYVCITSVDREFFKEFPLLSKQEEDSMYAVIDEILNNNGNPLGINDAINLVMNLGNPILPEKALNILKSFVSKNILVESQRGFYYLGPLVLTSLKFYLSNHQNGKTCALCTKNVVHCKYCDSCGAYMHYYCFQNAQQYPDDNICPSCQN